jgi:hypothetical protein
LHEKGGRSEKERKAEGKKLVAFERKLFCWSKAEKLAKPFN